MGDSGGRKSHRKSKKGCRECKRRHVKCDEQQPTCSACARLDLICQYPRKAPARPGTLGAVLSSTTSDDAGSPQLQQDLWDTVDLELLHHYTTCCCVYVPGEHRKQLWTREIVSSAFVHDYLLYQIMAVSALHCYCLDASRKDLVAKAVKYRGRALQCIQPILANMDASLCIPVFGFAGLSMIFAYGELIVLRETEGQDYDPISHITECLQQNFGINTVVATYREDIQKSWASELINFNSDEEFHRVRSSNLVFAQAAMLHSLIESHEHRQEWRDACHEALDVLLQTIQILGWEQEDHSTFHLIMAWPSNLKPQFWELLKAKAPIALLVLAYFAALISTRPRIWWFQRWPRPLLEKINISLGKDWEEALAWPNEMVDMTPTQQR